MPGARPQIGRFLARATDGGAELFIYDKIGGGTGLFDVGGVTSQQVAAAVEECERNGAKSLSVYINSPGGDVFEGVAIMNCLKRFSGSKTVFVDGWAASIASVIAMAGDKIYMGSGSMMMIHNPSSFAGPRGVGTADEMRSSATKLDKIAASMAGAYAERAEMPESEILDLMKAETWMTADEAIKLGFADEKFEQEPGTDPTAYFASAPIFASFHNLPPALKAQATVPAGKPGNTSPKEHETMKGLLAKLGLSDSASEAQAITAFEHIVGTSRKLIEATGAATEGEALGTVSAWKASHERVGELNARLAKIEAETAKAEVKALVDAAIKDGKATPAQRDSLMLMSPETLKAFVAAAPVIHKPAKDPQAEGPSATTLSAEEQEICRKMGRDPKQFLEAKKKAIEEGRAPDGQTLRLLASAPA